MRFTLLLLLFAAATLTSHAARPGQPRVTWTSAHFELTIDSRKSRLLPDLAALAEACHAKQKAHFAFEPTPPIRMIFLDEEDYANGYAYAAQGWAVILLHPADFEFRGRTPWLPNVVAHELGHLFTLRKMGRRSRFLGFSLFHDWTGKSGTRSEAAYRFDFLDVPPWLAEGLAQHAARVCGYDSLDTRRRMVLRTAAASGGLLSLAEMDGFAWDGRRNEMVYTQGFALVSHLYATRGREAMNRFLAGSASGWKGAFRAAFAVGPQEAYQEWRAALEMELGADARADSTAMPAPEEPIAPPQGLDYVKETAPVVLSDGRVLFLSSRRNDYGITDLWVADAGRTRRIYRNVTSVTPDRAGQRALFTAVRYHLGTGGPRSDLMEYTPLRGIQRLSRGARIVRGLYGPGDRILALRNEARKTSLVEMTGEGWDTLYVPPDSQEVVDALPGRDDTSLALVTTSAFGSDIHRFDLATRTLSPLIATPADETDPAWRGDTLWFASDAGGRHDLYALPPSPGAGTPVRLTREAGGAFRPFPAPDGTWYSAYGPRGFTLKRLPPGTPPATAPEVSDTLRDTPVTEAAPSAAPPAPAWNLPPPVTVGKGYLDRSGIGFLGWALSLGVIRLPGYREADTAGGAKREFSFSPGSFIFTTLEGFWLNPAGTLEVDGGLGYSMPGDYDGVAHIDRTRLEFRLHSFVPSYVLGAQWWARDFPHLKTGAGPADQRTAYLQFHLGTYVQLAQHWWFDAWGFALSQNWYAGEDDVKVGERGPNLGHAFNLAWFDYEPGKDGLVSGISARVGWEADPDPEYLKPEINVGVSWQESFRRRLQFWAFAEMHRPLADSLDNWLYGNGGVSVRLPLGFKLGPQAGPGLFFDALFPGVELLGLARQSPLPSHVTPAVRRLRAQARPAGVPAGAWTPDYEPFASMALHGVSREIAFLAEAKVLNFFSREARWRLRLRYDLEDFSRDPVFDLRLSF